MHDGTPEQQKRWREEEQGPATFLARPDLHNGAVVRIVKHGNQFGQQATVMRRGVPGAAAKGGEQFLGRESAVLLLRFAVLGR